VIWRRLRVVIGKIVIGSPSWDGSLCSFSKFSAVVLVPRAWVLMVFNVIFGENQLGGYIIFDAKTWMLTGGYLRLLVHLLPVFTVQGACAC